MCKKITILSLALFLLGSVLFGQSRSSLNLFQLDEALSNGFVSLVSANGTGHSTGGSVTGKLLNNTETDLQIFVIIKDGLYLANEGEGQSMIATQIYLDRGRYNRYRSDLFINLPAYSTSDVLFRAYCADFDLPNPEAEDFLEVYPIPYELESIASTISRYMADVFSNVNEGIDVPVQLALWRTQDFSRLMIVEKFNFTDADWELSDHILGYSDGYSGGK